MSALPICCWLVKDSGLGAALLLLSSLVEVDVGSLDSSLPGLNDASAEERIGTACSKHGFQTIETLTHSRRHMTRPGMWALGVSRYLVAAWGFVRCLNGYMPAQPAGALAVACVRQVGLEVSLLQVPYPVPPPAQTSMSLGSLLQR